MQGSTGLLDQLGGSSQLKALTDAFVNNVASHPRSSKLLSGADLGTLETKVSDQFCSALGGGCQPPLTSAQITEAAKKLDAPTSSGLTDSLMKALDTVKASPIVKEGADEAHGSSARRHRGRTSVTSFELLILDSSISHGSRVN